MRKALIAHGSEELTIELAKMLGGFFDVATCNDGISALNLIRSLQPYALILDLTLPYKDGLSILDEAAPIRPPVILGMIRDRSAYVLSSATDHGIGYVMLDPSETRAIVVRLIDMVSYIDIPTKAYNEPQSNVTKLLLKLGLSPDSDGFKQLQVAIPIFLEDPLQRLSKELYPAVAKICNYNGGQQVEHSIRMSIQTAWTKNPTELWGQLFPHRTKAPNNRLFISRIATALQEGKIIE